MADDQWDWYYSLTPLNISLRQTNASAAWEAGMILIPGIPFALVNIFTLAIHLFGERLRKPSNYPILSLLLSATFHSLLTTRVDVFQQLFFGLKNVLYPRWLCDVNRFSYFFFSHLMKISLLLDSFNRVLATIFPFLYRKHGRRVNSIMVPMTWLITMVIDIIPFLPNGRKRKYDVTKCSYLPGHAWGVIVLLLFNTIVFFIMACNYIIIWRLAFNFSLKDRMIREQVINSCDTSWSESDFSSMSTKARAQRSRVSPLTQLRLLGDMKATRTSLLLLSVYVLCWGPSGVYYLTHYVCPTCINDNNHKLFLLCVFILKTLSFLSGVVVPVVYCWRTKECRRATYKMCCYKRYQRRAFLKDRFMGHAITSNENC